MRQKISNTRRLTLAGTIIGLILASSMMPLSARSTTRDPTPSAEVKVVESPGDFRQLDFPTDPRVMVINPASLSFGVVAHGASKGLPVTFTNLGTDTLHVFGVQSDVADFSGEISPRALGPGESMVDTIHFYPAYANLPHGSLRVFSDAPSSPDLIVVTGICNTCIPVAILPDSMEFGTMMLGSTMDTTFTVANYDNDTLFIYSIPITSPSVTLRSSKDRIPPHASLIDTIHVIASSIGTIEGEVYISSNKLTVHMYFHGIVKGTPLLQFSSTAVSFGEVDLTSSVDSVVVLTNHGTDTLHVASLSSSLVMFHSSLAAAVIPPGMSVTDTIRFAPTTVGVFAGTIIVQSDAATSPDSIPVSGIGIPNFWQRVDIGNENAMQVVVNHNGHVFVGTPGDGIFRSTDNGATWTQTNNGISGSGMATYITALATSEEGYLFIGTIQDGVYRSTNDGDSWTQVNTGLNPLWVECLYARSGGLVYAGTNNSATTTSGVFRSTNNGNGWVPLNLGVTNVYVRSLAGDDHGNIFAGTLDQGVFRSTDTGTTWTMVLSTGTQIPAFSIVQVGSGDVFVTTTGSGIFRSTNYGGSWTQVDSGLTSQIVFCLVSAADGSLFAGTESQGVFRSTNSGDRWFPLNTGLKSNVVFALAGSPAGSLFAASQSDGLFRSVEPIVASIQFEDPRIPDSYVLFANYPNPFNPSTTIRFGLASRSNVTLKVFNTLGQGVATLVDGDSEAGYHEVRFDGSGLASGVYFYRIQAGNFVQTKKLILLR